MSARNAATPDSVKAGGQREGTTTSSTTTVTRTDEHTAKRYQLSEQAAHTLDQWWTDLHVGRMSLANLPHEVAAFVTLGEVAAEGRLASRIAYLEAEADRLWLAAFGSPVFIPTGPSFADRLRIRGEHDRAAAYESWLTERTAVN